MYTKFTPGPWAVTGQSDAGRYITVKAANGRTVARIPFSRENAPLSEITDASDADLIAAAPALYAALINMLDDGDKTDREQQIADAIKRRKGQHQCARRSRRPHNLSR